MLKRTYRAYLVLASFFFFAACQKEQPIEYVEEDSEEEKENAGERQTFTYNAVLTEADSASLSLANAQAFSMQLTNCASTQSVTITDASAYLELYEFDRNCLVKLTTFTLNDNVYTPKAGSTFDTWLAGDVAIFEVVGATPADELTVEVITTVGNPVVAGGTIHYQFSDVEIGDDETIGEAVVRESQGLTVDGQAAPKFKINQIEFVGLTASGNGEFRFQLECDGEAVTGAGATLQCYDVLLNSITMVLAKDTFGGGEPTLANLDTIFDDASGGVAINMGTEAFAAGAGTPVLTNGGFITANTGDPDVMVMSGVKPIVSNPAMLFILKSGPSYRYYHIDVTTIVQSDDDP